MTDTVAGSTRTKLLGALLALLLPFGGAAAGAGKSPAADAYYHFGLAHLYYQLAMQYVNQEYLDRAQEEYQKAIEADPDSIYLRLELIELYARTNRLEEARAEAQKVLEKDPGNIEVRELLGRVYKSYASGRTGVDPEYVRKAVEQFEEILKVQPNDADALAEIASLYRSIEEREKAEEALERLIEVDPSSTEALTKYAFLQLEMENTQKALEALERVREKGGAGPEQLAALANAYEQANQHEKAAEIYRQLMETAGDNLPARQRLAHNLVLSEQYDEALEHYKRLVEADPDNPEFHLRLSQIYREQRRFAEAHEHLDRASELSPESLEIGYNRVLLLENEGRTEDAIQALEEILSNTGKRSYNSAERRNRALFLEQLGVLRRSANQFGQAVEAFRTMGEIHPESKQRALSHIIDTYRFSRQFDKVEKAAKEAYEEFPDSRPLTVAYANSLAETGQAEKGAKLIKGLLDGSPSGRGLYLSLAQVYEKGDLFDKAVEAAEKALQMSESEAQRVDALFTYGSVLERAKRYDEAEEKFRALLEIDPKNAAALNYLGYMLADNNEKLDEAHDMIQRALDIDPGNGAYLDSLGWVYYRQNQLELAERYLQRSVEKYQRDPVVHSHLADVYYELGKIELAKTHWQRSLEEWENSPEAERDPAEIKRIRQRIADAEVRLADKHPAKEGKN